MEKQQAKKLLEDFRYWEKISKAFEEQIANFCNTLCSGSHTPSFDHLPVDGFVEGIRFNNNELAEEFEYIYNETPFMDSADVLDIDKKKYDFCKDNDIIKYLVKHY